jgi:putative oxidoreductase
MIKTLGNLFLGALCVYGGFGTFVTPDNVAGVVEAKGLPYPRQLAILNATVMLVAGSTLAASVLPKLSATLLIGSVATTTVVGHPFWQETDAKARRTQSVQFYKNLASLGGYLLVLAERND